MGGVSWAVHLHLVPSRLYIPSLFRNLLLVRFLPLLVRVSLGLKFVLVNFLDKDFFTF